MATTSRVASSSKAAAVAPLLRRAASSSKAKVGVTAPTTYTATTSKPSLPPSSAPAISSSVPPLREGKEGQIHEVCVNIGAQCLSPVEEQALSSSTAVASLAKKEADDALAADEEEVGETPDSLSLAITTVAATSSTSPDDATSSSPAASSSTTPNPPEHPDTAADAKPDSTPTAPVGHASKPPTKTSGTAKPKSKVLEKAKEPPRTKAHLPPAKMKEKREPVLYLRGSKLYVHGDVEEQALSSSTTPAQAVVTSSAEMEVSPTEETPGSPSSAITTLATSATSPSPPATTSAPAPPPLEHTTVEVGNERFSGVDSTLIAPVGHTTESSSKGKAVEEPPLKKPRLPPVPVPVKEKRALRVVSAPVPSKIRPRVPVDARGKEKESVVRKVDEMVEATIAVATTVITSTTQKNNNNNVEFTFRSPPPESPAANDGSTSTPPSLTSTSEGPSVSHQPLTTDDDDGR
ncbi:hypothetical protein V5O48_012548 [Marasmius crinis-equi]|uniref:Uncharacterized protein n=1 Tax=Marasmius crinis-equi TaxID=585013 RepID=A0ABR3F2H5_9AGAR